MLLAVAVDLASNVPLLSAASLIALLTLTIMEIVLGIDNIVFIAIITGKLPPDQQSLGRRVGLFLAMLMRIMLLFAIGWVMSLTTNVVTLSEWIPIEPITSWLHANEEANHVNWRDLILFGGGLYLLYSAVNEIHHKSQGEDDEHNQVAPQKVKMSSVLMRIAFMDMIFSLDSVITAVGMASHIEIMIAAVVIAVGVMIIFANQISNFVERHPTVKMLALSFLILIGVVLISEAAGTPISKGYVYFAMAFSLAVEVLNLRSQGRRHRPGPGEGEVGVIDRN
jgi:predicted tellurium resistance membrane protein TerC